MTGGARGSTHVERVGGVLVAPRTTFERVLDEGEGRAISDVTWLLIARVVVGQTPRFVRAALLAADAGLGVGLSGALGALQAGLHDVIPDLLGIFLGGLVMSLFVGRQAQPHGRTLELASYAWVPYLTVQVAVTLGWTLVGRTPGSIVYQLAQGIGAGWSVGVWAIALAVLRRRARGGSDAGGPAAPGRAP